ncbi:MAG: hypothetical protein V3S48_01465 [Candidatus Neomarinimicrobiota bacterium]
MKLSSYWKNLLKTGICGFSFLLAGDQEIIALTPQIGFNLDPAENKYYGVFTDITGFESAQFYQVTPNRIEVQIVFVEFARKKKSRRAMNLRKYSDLQVRIKQMRVMTDSDREKMADDFTYLKTEEILSSIIPNQYVDIEHRSGKKIKGTFLEYKKQKLVVQTPVSIQTIPVWDMEKISFREQIIKRPKWKLQIYGLSALLGLGLMEVWNVQTKPRTEMVWHNRFMGSAIGTLAGAEFYDTMIILLTPKTHFALTPAELEQLKNN